MYIKLLDKIINTDGIIETFIDDNKIIIKYQDYAISIDYSEVKFDVNAEKQKIEIDFEKLELSLITDFEQIIADQKDEILKLEHYKSDSIIMKHILNTNVNPFKKIKWLKGILND